MSDAALLNWALHATESLKRLGDGRKVLDAANLLFDGYASLNDSEDLGERATLLDSVGSRAFGIKYLPEGDPDEPVQKDPDEEPPSKQVLVVSARSMFHAASAAERLNPGYKVQFVYDRGEIVLWRFKASSGLYFTGLDGDPNPDY